MPNIQVQLRRGDASDHTTFSGAEGEVTVDTTNDTLHVHTGGGAGTGVRLAKYSELAGAGAGGTVTSVGSGTGLTGGPITSSGTLSIANDGVDTAQIADDAVTHDKISTTDSVFKINSSDQVRIGGSLNNSALESVSQLGVTSSTAQTAFTVESTATSQNATAVLTAPGNATLQLNDTSESATDTGVYNVSSLGGEFQIGSIAVGGGGSNLTCMSLLRKTLSAVDYIVPQIPNLPTFADNSAATSGGLDTHDVYKTSTGELRIVV